jgi:hypothetical protein
VARLSQRYGLLVRLVTTPGGGVTALVTLPANLVSERRETATLVDRGGGLGARLDSQLDPRPAAAPVSVGVAGPAGPAIDLLPPSVPAPAAPPSPAPAPPVTAPAPATAGEPELVPPAWWWESEAFVRPPAEDPASAAPGDPEAPAPPAAGGLARRTPGTHLAPALRRNGAAGNAAPGLPGGRDRAQVGTMLSRFQASQRAGRAAADSPRNIHPRSPREHPPHP